MVASDTPENLGEVSLREVTKETLRSILNLEVTEEQRRLVAPNAMSIAEAYFEDRAWFRAIYAGGLPVGFVMLYLDEEEPSYWIWRYMIDRAYQGQGYGYQAMLLVMEHVRSLPEARELYVSYVPAEGDAAPFYEKLGFVETGEWIRGERVMKLTL